MFARISNGFLLVRSSWGVLVKDKHLLWFPIVSGFLFLLVLVSFAVPLAVLVDWNQFDQQLQANNGHPPVWMYAVSFAFYFCTYFVIIFCNSALVSCALMRFNGETPTLRDGFGMAVARLPQILAWALVSATVGLILKVIENLHERAGEIIAWLMGTAWTIMTFFVVPVLVVEKVGPFQAIGRSIALIKQTWGEALVGRLGVSLVLFLLLLPVLLVLILGVVLLVSGNVPVGVVLLAVGVVLCLLHMAVSSALHTILLSALYQYAAQGVVPQGFDHGTFKGAFAQA